VILPDTPQTGSSSSSFTHFSFCSIVSDVDSDDWERDVSYELTDKEIAQRTVSGIAEYKLNALYVPVREIARGYVNSNAIKYTTNTRRSFYRSYGRVTLHRTAQHDIKIALKHFYPNNSTREHKTAFQEFYASLQVFHHPAFVRCYDYHYNYETREPVVTMDFVDGRNLEDLMPVMRSYRALGGISTQVCN